MDVLGATASVLTLVDVAIKTTKLIGKLIKQYHNLPADIFALTQKVEVLNGQILLLRLLGDSIGSGVFELGGDDLTAALQGCIGKSTSVLSEICAHFDEQSLVDGDGKRRRLKWAFIDASKIRHWDITLQQQSAELSGILILLNLWVVLSKSLYVTNRKDRRSSSLLHSKIESLRPCVVPRAMASEVLSQVRLVRTFHYFRDLRNIPLLSKFQGSFSLARKGKEDRYKVSLRLQALFCLKVLFIDMRFRQQSLFSMGGTAFGMDIKVRNLVKEDSEVMVASKRGDIETVWALFQAGKASVRDVTSANRSPLRKYAIESGSSELVRYLINNGANVNEYCGLMQTNLVQCAFAFSQIEIARILISHGTEIHHINATGWTPAFHIFGAAPNATFNTSHESLEILSAASFSDFDTQDQEGWTCMHRAAAYGCAEDIRLLLKLNVTTNIQTIKVCWTPIFCAVHFGNISTFDELRRIETNFLALRDVRRWTLLHVAVNAKRLDMIEHLVRLGADPHARTLATKFLVPGGLKDIAATPANVAVLRGDKVFARYVEALINHGHDIQATWDNLESEQDIFWQAVENP
ncbi:hypothetical protein VTL71DRAFT_14976 [Oculimacula yallundae]|uniref:Ankyrin n=1 Tax=Oculimacula yallundae TaxID=86028 RepID=A0ABR4CFZ2_9HELO